MGRGRQGGGEAGPTGTRATTVRRANCGVAHSANYARDPWHALARVQRIDEQIVEVLLPQITTDIGEEIVDVTVPPVDASEVFQLQVCAISTEIQGNYSGKEEFLPKKHELRMQQDECFKKIDALWEQKIRGVLDKGGDRVAESGGFDSSLLLNEQMGVLMEEKKDFALPCIT